MLSKKHILNLSERLESSEALFFDFDGTLVDSIPVLYKVYIQFMRNLSLEASLEEFQSLNGPSMLEVIAILQKKHRLEKTPETLYKSYSSLIEEAYGTQVSLLSGVLEFLAAFKDKKLVIVTSAERSWVEVTLGREGILSAFQSVITPSDEPGKPNPAIYLRALKELGLTPEKVLTFEDSKSGVNSSVSAGISTLRISNEKDDLGQLITFNNWTTLASELRCVEKKRWQATSQSL